MCFHVSTVHPVGRWMHYVFDLSKHLCVNVCLSAHIPSRDISRSACRRLLLVSNKHLILLNAEKLPEDDVAAKSI